MLTLDLPIEAKEQYYKLLQVNAALSRLFSDSPTPLLTVPSGGKCLL